MKNHFLTMMVLLFCSVLMSAGLGSQTKVFGQKQEVLTIEFCDLISQPAKYAGRLVRIRAEIITGIDNQMLTDKRCNESADPAFPDCSGDPKCKKAEKRMRANIDYVGDFWRVEVIVVGELEVSPSTSSFGSASPPNFIIKTIENSFKIPHKASFP